MIIQISGLTISTEKLVTWPDLNALLKAAGAPSSSEILATAGKNGAVSKREAEKAVAEAEAALKAAQAKMESAEVAEEAAQRVLDLVAKYQ